MVELIPILPWAAFAVLVPIVFRRGPKLDRYPAPARDGDAAPLVTIVVPARDEAQNIGACAATLLGSSYPRREIVVVDDESTDGTREVAEALAERSRGLLRVVAGEPLPEGWVGKPWACWQGYREARGDLLLFTDADTRHDEELLGRAVGALEAEDADLLTVIPRQRMGTFWERLIMPHIGLVIRLRYADLTRVNRTHNPRDVLGNGQFLLVRRGAYEAVGGHEAIRGEIVEDLRLAQRFVRAGHRVLAARAENLMETRMYRSLAGIVEGWSKNLAIGSQLSVPGWLQPFIAWLLPLFLLSFWVAPPIAFASGVTSGAAGATAWGGAATLFSLVFWVLNCLYNRVPVLYSLLYPLGAVAAAWLFVRSALRGGRVEWKGREYLSPRPSRRGPRVG